MNMGTWGSSPYKWNYMPIHPIHIFTNQKLAEACRYLNLLTLLGRPGALSFLKCPTLKVGWVSSQSWRPRELQLAGGACLFQRKHLQLAGFLKENSWKFTITRDDQCTMILYPMYI